MSTFIDEVQKIARQRVNSAKKRAQIAKYLKKSGFIYLGKGYFLGFRNRDIISGLIIDSSPFDTYITAFILPAFDKLEYINWSLGERIVHCEPSVDSNLEVKKAIEHYCKTYLQIKSSAILVEYINHQAIVGDYAVWAIFICYLRNFDFDSSISCLAQIKLGQLPPNRLRQVTELSPVVSSRDKVGVDRIFEEWSAVTERIFGPLDHAFDLSATA